MRKFLSILFVLALSSVAVFGQVAEDENRYSIAVEGGPSFSKPLSSTYHFERTMGSYFGVMMGYVIDDVFILRVGISNQRKGGIQDVFYTNSNKDTTGTGTMLLRQNYLTIPLTFRAYLDKNQRFFLGGGAYLGFLLRSTGKYDNATKREINTSTYAGSDIGFNLGAGIQQRISKLIKLSLEAQYNYGVDNVLPQPKGRPTIPNWNHQATSVLLGVQYTIPYVREVEVE
ncbi:MAG: outer membrane beta-barrel protein [Bacteroidota bacterium]